MGLSRSFALPVLRAGPADGHRENPFFAVSSVLASHAFLSSGADPPHYFGGYGRMGLLACGAAAAGESRAPFGFRFPGLFGVQSVVSNLRGPCGSHEMI